MLNFFILEDNEIKINKIELYLIPSARALVQADKGGMIHGDYDGRKKLMATKKLGVAWWCVDINSPGIQQGLEGDELLIDAMNSLDTPKEWIPKEDKEFNDFLQDYTNQYNKASYIRLLKELLISFDETAEIVAAIRKQTKKTRKDKIDLDAEDMKLLIASQNQIIAVASETPAHMKRLRDLQIIAGRQEKEQSLARGDKTITNSMNPNH